VLCNIDEENEGYTYAFQWLNVYRNGLDTFGENLVLDDVMTEDEITEAKKEQDAVVLLTSSDHP
jgi:hypothetical protein